MRQLLSATAAVVILSAATAPVHAGPTRHGWLYGTEVLPERQVELETWIVEEDGKGADHVDESTWWIGPVVGVTDRLELAIPLEINSEASDSEPTRTFGFKRYGVEARWRLVSADPVEAPAIAPLVRFAVKRLPGERDAAQVESDLVVSWERGRVAAVVDLGVEGELRPGLDTWQLRPGAGASVRAVGDLRLGLEAYAELTVHGDDTSWFAVGPSLAWSHGRFWLAASAPIGIVGITAAPRLNWGIAF